MRLLLAAYLLVCKLLISLPLGDYQHSAYNVKECRLSGLLDLNQGDPYVRGKMQEYLNRLVDMGVAGFRCDASKHMWPEDLKNLLAGVKDLRADVSLACIKSG